MKKSSRSGSLSTGVPVSSNTATVNSSNSNNNNNSNSSNNNNSSINGSDGGKGNRTNIHNNHNDNSNSKKNEKKMDNNDQDVNSMFRRTEIIGRGKFGIVYKGYHIKTKHVYAIKVLNLDSDEDEVEDVQREVQFLSSLKQIPNITRYYGSYLKNTSLWIIMEYCAGGSLRSLLRPGKVDEKYIGVIMKEVLIALKYIHRENIIHRDIKAANILITNSGSVKLCDFGVAAQLNQATLRRQTMAGTPYWMAPEVIMEGVYYDTKVDIWSLGITAYEIATGNPPYCDVEAIRAMQLITKSKPPRLEGRDYSAPLKKFIALCLDEDPNERLEADELLNCKFIKLHKNTPTSILKELVTRYLLFRDKHKNDNQSVTHADDIKHGDVNMNNNDNNKKNKIDKGDNIAKDIKHNNTNICEYIDEASQSIDNISVRWDFDSLSSTDYIIENNINIEAISEETPDWQHEQVNYAYPEEDHYSYYPTSNNTNNLTNMVTNSHKYAYQGTTIGKYNPNTTYQNSTFDVPITHMNTTGNYPSKMILGTGTQVISNKKETIGTYNTTLGSNRKLETKAPKQLLELFEDTEVIPEIDSTHEENRRTNKNKSVPYLDTLNEDVDLQIANDSNNIGNKSVNNNNISTTTSFNINNPHNNLVNAKSYFTQSAPQLPHLQTTFTTPSNELSTTLMTAPTSVEIEIPEELPVSALPTPVPIENPSHLQTKPRSSTVSISPLAYQQQQHITSSSQAPHQLQQSHGLTRRLTLGGINNTRSNDNETNDKSKVVGKTIAEEISRSASFANVSNISTSLSNRVIVNDIPKTHRKTPSPAKIAALAGVSPTKKPGVSPTGIKNISNTENISDPSNSVSITANVTNVPAMRPIASVNESKDALLHPVNVNNITSSHFNTTYTDNKSMPMTSQSPNIEKETSRINADFKRNNPNLKLQMPLPKPINKHNLLDSSNIPSTESINQFGFNTSVTQNAPVSMTPINEKYMDFNNKLKRSQSVSNRKNSATNDSSSQVSSTSNSALNQSVSTNIVNNHNISSFGNSTISDVDNYQTINGTNEVLENSTAINVKTGNTIDVNENNIASQTTAIHTDNTTSSATVTTTNSKNSNINNAVVMAPPSSMLRMSLFQDLEQNSSFRRVDRKPEMLKELDKLLHLFEENLPAMENALKRQLVPSTNTINPISTTTTTATTIPNTISITKSNSVITPELQSTTMPTVTESISNSVTSSVALTEDMIGRS
ncbi:hypothetical protein RI543_000136 [Arxiozyma heterogenica]|uniref:non-specific serine/threonine protein kinase n=1 Tax=Arxiozyma heterogenica TaxID=278026 RepID=A0AAN8A877_9SACH|nr:hypothetical protein RI543_000136 [Kazachstania heterogenica]